MNMSYRSALCKNKRLGFCRIHAFTSVVDFCRLPGLVAVVGSLLLSSGCGIPNLRCPQPGPTMPPVYNIPNQGLQLSPDGNDGLERVPEIQVDEQFQETSFDSQTNAESQSFTSFVQAASAIDFDLSDDAVGQVDNDQAVTSDPGSNTENVEPQANETVTANDPVSSSSDIVFESDFGPQGADVGFTSWENSSQLAVAQFFADPYLLGLIDQALVGNQELRILSEEIRIAGNEVLARSGEYRPFVTLGGGAGLEKSSRFSRAGAVEDQLEGAPGRGFPDPLPDFLVASNVSWELDIWKRLRNAQTAAAMRYLATGDGRNYIVTRMVAEVAENYYELLALDNRMLILDRTIEIQAQSLEIAEAKKKAGRGTELAVQRFQAEVRKNQSEKLIIAQQIVEVENRINFLLGRYPQPIDRPRVEYTELNLHSLSAGVPAELLRNRADIRQAERELAAAGLDVKVARARFYPSLGLRAGVGLNAFNTRYLLSTPESLIYNVAADMVGPLINKRAIKADYLSANARQLQALYDYQRTILTAHIEVVNFMTKVDNFRQSIEVKRQQVAALEASVDSATKLFQNARAEYVEVLLAQREMMEAKMVLVETKQQQLSAIINAYQALGGGGF
jgi:NodT family efflux transporter outer membrane factor (OMF) lipoprotein